MNKKQVVVFIKASIGELHVSLPLLHYLKQIRKDDVEIIFASRSKKILSDLNVFEEYQVEMATLGTFSFGKRKLIKLIVKSIFSSKPMVIMTCDNGPGKFEKILYALVEKAHILHYHHAFALHSQQKANQQFKTIINPSKRYIPDSSILLNSESSTIWYKSIGFELSNILKVGSLGYKTDWINYIFGLNKSSEKNKSHHCLTVFIPLRDIHPLYLTEENHNYLIESLIDLFNQQPENKFILKLHPRQKNRQWITNKIKCLDNVTISSLSTFQLAAKADLTLSMWSSAITDSLAVMTPAVEFHRHQVIHPQLVEKKDGLISIYYDMGLCKFFTDGEELIEFMQSLTAENLSALLSEQRANFNSVFNLDAGVSERLNIAFQTVFDKAEQRELSTMQKMKNFFSIYTASINKKYRKLISKLNRKRNLA